MTFRKCKFVFLGGLLFFMASLTHAKNGGRVCVMKTSTASFSFNEPLSAGNASTGPDVFVQIDESKSQQVSPEKAADFTGLGLKEKHRVNIYDNTGKKQLISFFFSFDEKGSEILCMKQNSMYRTWALESSGVGCACPAP